MDDNEIQSATIDLLELINTQIQAFYNQHEPFRNPFEVTDGHGVPIVNALIQAKVNALLTLALVGGTEEPEKPAPIIIQNLYGAASEINAAEIFRHTKSLLSQVEIEEINKRRREATSPDIPEVQRAVEDRVGKQLQAYPLLKEFYMLFREAVLKAEVAVSEEASIKMNVLDDLIRE